MIEVARDRFIGDTYLKRAYAKCGQAPGPTATRLQAAHAADLAEDTAVYDAVNGTRHHRLQLINGDAFLVVIGQNFTGQEAEFFGPVSNLNDGFDAPIRTRRTSRAVYERERRAKTA